MNSAEDPDQELILRTLEGDLSAFDQLVTKHQAMIARCLYRFSPAQNDLEDLVQETFIKAYRKLEKKNTAAPFQNWLRRIAYNTGHDYFRKSKRTPISHTLSEDLDPNRSDGIDDLHKSQSTETVQHILSHLKADDRMLLTLQYLEEQSLQEIADTTGWSLTKTKVKSFRAKQQLRKLLKHYKIDEA